MTVKSIVEAIRDTLDEELANDDRVMVLGEDVGKSGGVFRATDGLQAKYGIDRVVDMPVAEAVIIGASIGLATAGMIPVAEMQFLGFSHQAFHQISHQLARWRYRTNGRFNAPVTIRAPFGGGVRAPELHSDAFENIFTQGPGLKIVAPATAADAAGLLRAAIRDADPVLFLEPLRGYRLVRDDVPDGEHTVPLGKARIARSGSDVTVIAWSAMVQTALEAASRAAALGIDVEVLDLRTIKPMDEEAVAASVKKTNRVVVVEEGWGYSGFGAQVADFISRECFDDLDAPVTRVHQLDVNMAYAENLERLILPSTARVVEAVHQVLYR